MSPNHRSRPFLRSRTSTPAFAQAQYRQAATPRTPLARRLPPFRLVTPPLLLALLAGFSFRLSSDRASAQVVQQPRYQVTGQVGGAAGPVAAPVDGSRMVAAFGRRVALVHLPPEGGARIDDPGAALPGHILALAAFPDGRHAAALLDGHRLASIDLDPPEGPSAISVVGLPGYASGSGFPLRLSVAEGRIFVGLMDRLVIYQLEDIALPLPPPAADLPLTVTAAPASIGDYLFVPMRGADDFEQPLLDPSTIAGGGPPVLAPRPAWSGLRVLDLSEAARPLVVTDLSLAHGEPRSMAAWGSTLLIGHGHLASLVDAQDPRRPRVVAEIEEPAMDVALGASPIGPPVALLATQENIHFSRSRAPSINMPQVRLTVLDLARPTTPRVLGRHDLRGSQGITGLVVAGGRAALSTRATGLRVLDLSTPTTALRTLARREAAPLRLVATDGTGDLAVALGQAGEASFQQVGLQKLLVVDPVSRTILSELAGLAPAEDLALHARVAALVGPTGLQLVDLSDPEQPRLAGLRGDLVDARRVALAEDLAAVADGAGGLRLFDISDPYRPVPASSIPFAEPVTTVALRVGHAFLTTPRTLHAVDIRDPLRPVRLKAANPAPPENPSNPFHEPFDALFDLVLVGVHAYASDGSRSLHGFDLSQPDRPRLLFQEQPVLGGRLIGRDDRLWMLGVAASIGSGSDRIIALDREEELLPQRSRELRIPPAVHDAALLPGARVDTRQSRGDDLLVAADAAGLIWLDEGPDAPPTAMPTPARTATRPAPPTAAPPDPAHRAQLYLPLVLRPEPAPKRALSLTPPELAGGEAHTLAAAGDRTWLTSGRRLALFEMRTDGSQDRAAPEQLDSIELASPARLVAGDEQVAALILQPELSLHPQPALTIEPGGGGYPPPPLDRTDPSGTGLNSGVEQPRATPSAPQADRSAADTSDHNLPTGLLASGGESLPPQLQLIVAGEKGLRSVALRALDSPVTALHVHHAADRRILLVARWSGRSFGEAVLDIYDASRPSAPELLSSRPLDGAVLRMASDGPRLLLSLAGTRGPHGLLSLDLSHPESPREIGFAPLSSRQSTPRGALAIIQGRAYVGQNDEWIDVLELGEDGPRHIGRFTPALTHSLSGYVDFAGQTEGDAIHVLQMDGVRMTTFDLSDLRQVPATAISVIKTRHEFELGLPEPPRVAVAGSHLFVAGGIMGGLRAIALDISPDSTGILDRYRHGGGPGRVDLLATGIEGDAATLVALTTEGDVTWMGGRPREAQRVLAQQVGGGDFLGPLTGIAVAGARTWMTGLTTPLAALSVEAGEPRFDVMLSPNFGSGFAALPPSHRRIEISEDFAWITEAGTGLRVFDLSQRDQPQQVGLHFTPGRARDLALSDMHVLIADGPGGLVLLDRRNPATPREVGHRDLGGDAQRVVVDPATPRAWLAVLPRGARPGSRFPGRGRHGARLVEVDFRDPTAPRIAADLPLPTDHVFALARRAGSLFIAAGAAGLLVVDVSDPAEPALVGSVPLVALEPTDVPAGAFVTFAGLSGGGGPESLRLAPGPGAVDVVAARDPADPRIFVALGEQGMATLRISAP